MMTPAHALAAHSAAKAKINAAAAAASAAASEAASAAAAANAAATEALRRVVAARISDLPTPAQEPFGGITLEDIREFFSGTGTIERISCSPFPMRGPVLLVDVLLQYHDPAAAAAAVSAYHGSSMTGGPRCSLALSIFATDEILVEPGDPFSWDAANDGQNQLQGAIAGGYPAHGFQEQEFQDALGAGYTAARSGGHRETGVRRVVLAHITNLARPDLAPLGGLSVDGLHAVFSQCGTVEKIACTATPRTGLPVQFIDAMVQFATESEASSAVQAFDGTSLSSDNFHLAQMKFSKHAELRTSGNSERARVYVTTPQTTATATNGALVPHMYEAVPQAMKRPLGDEVLGASNYMLESASKRARGQDGYGPDIMGEKRRVVLAHITELPDPEVPPLGGLSVDDVHAVFARFGIVEKVVCVYFPKSGPPLDWIDAMVQFRQPSDAAMALQSLEGGSLTGDGFCRMQCKWSKHPELTKQGDGDCHRDYTQPGPSGGGVPHFVPPPLPPQLPQLPMLSPMHLDQRTAARGQMGDPTAVLAAFNLAEEIAEPDILFNVFSLYGYVEIVKVVFKRPRDTALVQFAEPAFVDLACDRLQGAVLQGRPMDVRRSRQQSIRCTEKDQSSIERTTRSYSPNDQFWSRKEYQKIFDNAAAPSRTLFVKNIAPQLNEHDLLPLFRQHGHVQDFAFLPCKAPLRFKTAVVQMGEVRDAMTCVAMVQRERFPREEGGEDMRLMVSFSKKDEMPRNVVRGSLA